MHYRVFRTLPLDAFAIVRAYPPMVICFAAALTGTALVFDVFYLVASPGLALAAVYTIPVLAGLIAGLVAAADDIGLERRVLAWTVAATVAVGITNIVVVAMIAAMRRTSPPDWGAGLRAVVLAGVSVLCVAMAIVVIGNLAHSLGIEIKTHFPRKNKPVYVPPAPLRTEPRPRASKEAAARAKPVRVDPPPEVLPEPVPEPAPAFTPPPPRVIDLDEPRPITPWVEGTGHADRRAPRARRGLAVPPSRHPNRPGRRPER